MQRQCWLRRVSIQSGYLLQTTNSSLSIIKTFHSLSNNHYLHNFFKSSKYLSTITTIHTQIPISNSNLTASNITITNRMKMGDYQNARKVFDEMRNRDVVTWNTMISGYVKNSMFEEALTLFKKMVNVKDIEPDEFTFASVIKACGRLGALTEGELVRTLMMEKRIKPRNSILSSALIDMYSKCGRIEMAKKLFNSVHRDDVSIYNAMINGLAIHGLGHEAIGIFDQMIDECVDPDSITFIGILKACSHCGLIEEGRQYFDLMSREHCIEPKLAHYGSMVDLLARAGFLEEAHEIIKTMPMLPDVVIWRSILGACRIYKKPKLGELAFANISSLESGDYVLLSNTYCSMSKWNIAQRVRETMKMKGVYKNRAKSWVEVNSVVHQFKSGDQSHQEIESVYKMLERLIRKTKIEGFVSATELVLMDVSEEEKEGNLYCHSEKLALCYGILKTSPGTEIRISKNLRTCHDCHSWIKMVSRVLGRVIVVRDRIRFHSFEGGFCSCKDYW